MPPLPRLPISPQAEPGGWNVLCVCTSTVKYVIWAGTANPTMAASTGLDTCVQMS